MSLRPRVSVVIPTYNEQGNIYPLAVRIDGALTSKNIKYELIFIDDYSTDSTRAEIKALAGKFPVSMKLKVGERGKRQSLLQGFGMARANVVAMIDADLQYPPEAIPAMLEMIQEDAVDVVVANRVGAHAGSLRRLSSRMFRKLFGKAVWKFDVDVQSGLKVFRKTVLERAHLAPGGRAFDLDFLVQARNGGYRIAGHNVDFARRSTGSTKGKPVTDAAQIAGSALRLRLAPRNYIPFDRQRAIENGHGFHYKGAEYVTHNRLKLKDIAVERTTLRQRSVILVLVAAAALFLVTSWHSFLVTLVTLLTSLYFADLLFNLLLVYRSFFRYTEISANPKEIARVSGWPRYTVFCPLYREAQVMPQFIAAMKQLDYPKDKLEVLLLLEEDDLETVKEIRTLDLPPFIKVVIVPDGMPKTKPKACNYGLLLATGEYAVIYDAEDIPDPDQLKKAVIAFQKVGSNVGCIQAKLNYYNWNQNLLTRLFTLEYSLWFNLILTGLQSVGAPIPLGGTSNHFRTKDLRTLGGWDPFNVTEDADLGMRIAKRGMTTAVLDSTTMEEANSEFMNWLKQRSRWIKGYMQTYLVHTREISQFAKTGKRINMLTFQLVVGGKILSLLINPLLWLMTLFYFTLSSAAASFIHSLYLGPIFYIGAVSLIFGNFLYVYYYMMGAARRGQPELIIYAIFVPVYWLMMSIAALYALRDLIVRPFHWHKTQHGLHLGDKSNAKAVEKLMVGARL
jgi:cellulose synthase/poly-beta-1,6-N-acetylglucosamine synthase-like glycosyltransferase